MLDAMTTEDLLAISLAVRETRLGAEAAAVPIIDLEPEATWVWADAGRSDHPMERPGAGQSHLAPLWEGLARCADAIVCIGDGQVRLWHRTGVMHADGEELRSVWRLEGSFTAAVWASDPPVVVSVEPVVPLPDAAVNLHDVDASVCPLSGTYREVDVPTRLREVLTDVRMARRWGP